MVLNWNVITGGLSVVVVSLPLLAAGGSSVSADQPPAAQPAAVAAEYAGEDTDRKSVV